MGKLLTNVKCIAELQNTVLKHSQAQGTLAPGEVQRIHLQLPRWAAYIPAATGEEEVKNALLSHLRVAWKVDGRTGQVALQSLSLSSDTLATLRGHTVSVDLALADPSSKPTSGCFTSLRATLHNNSPTRTGPLLVQVQAKLPGPFDDRRIAVAGSMSRLVLAIPGDGEVAVDFALCPLLAGRLGLVATVGAALRAEGAKGPGEGGRSKVLAVDVV